MNKEGPKMNRLTIYVNDETLEELEAFRENYKKLKGIYRNRAEPIREFIEANKELFNEYLKVRVSEMIL